MDSGMTLEGYLGDVNETEVTVDLGTSSIFTEEKLQEAAIQIKCSFASWPGFELHSLRYAGDEANTPENIDRLNALGDGAAYTEIAEFLSDFHSPEGAETLESNKDYTDYPWWLGRNADGGWNIVTTGND